MNGRGRTLTSKNDHNTQTKGSYLQGMPYADPERQRQYWREYRKRYRRRYPVTTRAKFNQWQRDNPDKVRTSRKRYAHRHPATIRAQQAVARAIKAGKLKRKPCELCGATPSHAHHPDYSSPLKVRWLCEWHHLLQHKKEKV